MKKRIVLFTLLFAALVFADVPYDSTYPAANTSANFTRYYDFPLDNIHILRLQDASMALGRNVSVLHDQLADYQAQQANQISGMQASIDSLQRAMNMQVTSLEQTVKKLDKPVPTPEPNNTPFNLLFLSNLILFGIVVVLLVVVHRKPLSEEHVHPAPPELVHYINSSRKAEHELRLELVAKGWKPSHIENALKIAKK